MNFTQAVKAMLEGKKVKSNNEVYYMEEGDNTAIISELDGGVVALDELINLTFEEVNGLGVLTANDITAVFNTEKNRWVSTTDAAKHRAAGRRVGVFTLSREL